MNSAFSNRRSIITLLISRFLLLLMLSNTFGLPVYAAVYDHPVYTQIGRYINSFNRNASSSSSSSQVNAKQDNETTPVIEEEQVIKPEKVYKSERAYQPAVYTPESENTENISLDISAGHIGYNNEYYIDDPSDNLFKFNLSSIASEQEYILSYDILGIENISGISKSFNAHSAKGGQLIKKSDQWVHHTENINKSELKKGLNYVLFTVPDHQLISYRIKNLQIIKKQKTVDKALIEFADQGKKFYTKDGYLYLKGQINIPSKDVILKIQDQKIYLENGAFETFIKLNEQTLNTKELLANVYQHDKNLYNETISISEFIEADKKINIENQLAVKSALVNAESSFSLNLSDATLVLEPGSVDNRQEISVSQLRNIDKAPLGSALINMTPEKAAYRFLPDGLQFKKEVKIALKYDKKLLPEGYSEKDIQIFFFDIDKKSWTSVPTDHINEETATITSSTTHFTDYIAGVIQVPESPETNAYTPTAISDIQVANPSAGIIEIQPPTANNQGDASVTYPIDLPKGTNGMQPSLSLTYNNNGGNGWLGLGWNLNTPSIEIDTRYGVPKYDSALETEAYLLNGEELLLNTGGENYYLPHRDNPVSRIPNAFFYPRVEGAFNTIERKGTSPSNYYWIITDRNGTKHYYGEKTGDRLTIGSETSGPVARWMLSRVVDRYGNSIDYRYELKNFTEGITAGGKQLYLKAMGYAQGNYTVNFDRKTIVDSSESNRPDISVSNRLGFKEVTYDLLSKITVIHKANLNHQTELGPYNDGVNITEYDLIYNNGVFGKTLLNYIRTKYAKIEGTDAPESEGYEHRFDYYNDTSGGLFEAATTIHSETDYEGKYDQYGVAPTGIGGGEGKSKSASGTIAPGIILPFFPASFLPISNAGTIHYSPSWSESENETRVSLIDMDGDGLPDKVFKKGNKITYRKNLGGMFGDVKIPVEGDVSMLVYSASKSRSETISLNLFGFNKEWTKSKANSSISTYYEDVNADGLIDIVHNGNVLFNRIDPNTQVPTFSKSSLYTPNFIRKESAVDPAALNALPELDNTNALMDVVKVWRAPMAGTINITGQISKQHISLENGIRYSIEHRSSLLLNPPNGLLSSADGELMEQAEYVDTAGQEPVSEEAIMTTNANTPIPVELYPINYIKEPSLMLLGTESTSYTNVTVKKNDLIFFRVNATNIPDELVGVKWNPSITYTSHNFDSPNGYKNYSSSYSDGFLLSSGSEYKIDENGAYILIWPNFTINNSGTTPDFSDEITFKATVYKVTQQAPYMHVLNTYTKKAKVGQNTEITSPNFVINGYNIDPYDAETYQFVKIEVLADSEINWRLLEEKFSPVIYKVGTGGNMKKMTPIFKNYPNIHTNYYKSNFAVTGTSIQINNNFNLNSYGCTDGNCKDRYVYLVAKNSNGKIPLYSGQPLKFRYKLNVSGAVTERRQYSNATEDYTIALPLTVTYSATDLDLHFEMYTDEYRLGERLRRYQLENEFIQLTNGTATKTTYINGGTVSQNRGLYKLNIYSSSNLKGFGPLYRNWGQFAYRGPQPGEAFQKIKYATINMESLVAQGNTSSDNSPSQTEDLEQVMQSDPSDFDGMSFDDVVTTYPTITGVAKNLGVFIPNKDKNAWELNEKLYVTKTEISPHQRFLSDDEIPMPRVDLPDDSNTYGAVSIIKQTHNVSDSETISFGFFGFNLGNTTTESENFVLNDYRDINGDGYPDILGAKIQLTSNKGGLSNHVINANILQKSNTEGSGYSAGGSPASVVSAVNSFGEAIGSSFRIGEVGFSGGLSGQTFDASDITQSVIVDINGDGLPDIINKNGILQLNTGTSFVYQPGWNFGFANISKSKTYAGGISMPPVLNLSNSDISAGLSISTTKTTEDSYYLDINGDGLPDLISGGSTVRFNTGSGFSGQSYALPGSIVQSSSNGGVAGNATICALFIIPLISVGVKICGSVGVSIGHTVNREHARYMDFNGDGYPDLVTSESNSEISVRLSKINRTNMLKTIGRPLGSNIVLDYDRTNRISDDDFGNTFKMPFKKWVLVSVEIQDGFSGDGEDVMKTAFEYKNGYKDRRERKFLGFGEVKTHQLKADGSVYRTAVQEYMLNEMTDQQAYLPGHHADVRKYLHIKDVLTKEYSLDEHHRKHDEKSYEYRIFPAQKPAYTTAAADYNMNSGSDFVNFTDKSRVLILLKATKATVWNFDEDSTSGSHAKTATELFHSYDKFGNLLSYHQEVDQINVEMTYHYDFNKNVLGIPKTHLVSSGGQFRKSETFIDAQTNIHRIRKYKTDAVTEEYAQYDMEYDPYGNMVKIIHPKGNLSDPENKRMFYKYTYDPDSHAHIIKVEDAYGYSSETKINFRGLPIETVDINNNKINYRYDPIGRMILVKGPYHKYWTIKNMYVPLFQGGPSYAITMHNITDEIGSGNEATVHTSVHTDGLGRVIQTKKQLYNHPCDNPGEGYRLQVSGKVLYDEFGRVTDTYLSQESQSCTGDLIGTLSSYISLQQQSNEKTSFLYDHKDRVTRSHIHGLNATTKTKYAYGYDNTGYLQFTEETTLPEGNKSIVYKDIKGRTTGVKQIGEGTELETNYFYDGFSQLIKVIDASDAATTYRYDNFGQKIRLRHPDAGILDYEYDLAGRLKKSITSNLESQGQMVTYRYRFNQLITVEYPSHSVAYDYGDPGAENNGAGRIIYQVDLTGSQKFYYGALGEVVRNDRKISNENGEVMYFRTSHRYDSWGRVMEINYPDNEHVIYKYNPAGQLLSITNSEEEEYLSNVDYNFFDQPERIIYGNGVVTRSEYDITQRLRAMQLSRPDESIFMRNVYRYNKNNNVIQVRNDFSQHEYNTMGGVYTRNYKYDDFNRLVYANGYLKGYKQNHNYELSMRYNATHGIVEKSQYHLLNTPNGAHETPNSYINTYRYEDSAPHAVTEIRSTDHTGQNIGFKNYEYDKNGNIIHMKVQHKDEGYNRDLIWDEQNRLIGVAENEKYYSQYVYDAGGERVLKKTVDFSNFQQDGGNPINIGDLSEYTIYPSGYLVVREKQYTKHYYSNGKKIVSRIGDMDKVDWFKNEIDDVTSQSADAKISKDRLMAFESLAVNNSSCISQINALMALYDTPLTQHCKQAIIDYKNQYANDPCQALEYIHQINCVPQDPDCLWCPVVCPTCPWNPNDPDDPNNPNPNPNPETNPNEPTQPVQLACLIELNRYLNYYLRHYSREFFCYEYTVRLLRAGDFTYCSALEFLKNTPDCAIPDETTEPVNPGEEEIIEEGSGDGWIDMPIGSQEPIDDDDFEEGDRKPIWWYHSDHLGSSSYLTDNFGKQTHYYEYLPFGETLAQQNQSTYYNNGYKFNGKEQDEETGFYYYGARYYEPGSSIWLSVDPLAEQFQGWTPYNYTLQNPVNLTDPTGMAPEGLDNEYRIYKSQGQVQKVEYVSDKGGDKMDFITEIDMDKPMMDRSATKTYFTGVEKSESRMSTNFGSKHGSTYATYRGPGYRHDVKYKAQSQAIEPMGFDSPFFVVGGVSSFLTKSSASRSNPTLRAAYEAEVSGLSSIAGQMRSAGQSSENIARSLHGMRRELGIKYKSLTPDDMLQTIYQRNIQKYGDKLGPSVDYLRQKGKSWDDIIESATRSGGKDLNFNK